MKNKIAGICVPTTALFPFSILLLLPLLPLPGSENSSRCSSSLGCLEPRPCPTHEQDVSPRDVQKKLLDKMQSLSIGSDSVSESGLQYDSESVTSMEESGRTTERRTSKPRFSFFKR